MGVQLNIKSAEARKLAEELAVESGDSITAAVTKALRERLQTVRREKALEPSNIRERERAINAIIEETSKLWPADKTMQNYDDMLYDERGLPH